MFSPVGAHEIFHRLDQLLFVFRKLHINEVHNNDPSDISKPELPRNFIGCFEVGLKCILLLVIAYTFISAVHVYYMKCFSVFNDEVSTTIEVYSFPE